MNGHAGTNSSIPTIMDEHSTNTGTGNTPTTITNNNNKVIVNMHPLHYPTFIGEPFHISEMRWYAYNPNSETFVQKRVDFYEDSTDPVYPPLYPPHTQHNANPDFAAVIRRTRRRVARRLEAIASSEPQAAIGRDPNGDDYYNHPDNDDPFDDYGDDNNPPPDNDDGYGDMPPHIRDYAFQLEVMDEQGNRMNWAAVPGLGFGKSVQCYVVRDYDDAKGRCIQTGFVLLTFQRVIDPQAPNNYSILFGCSKCSGNDRRNTFYPTLFEMPATQYPHVEPCRHIEAFCTSLNYMIYMNGRSISENLNDFTENVELSVDAWRDTPIEVQFEFTARDGSHNVRKNLLFLIYDENAFKFVPAMKRSRDGRLKCLMCPRTAGVRCPHTEYVQVEAEDAAQNLPEDLPVAKVPKGKR
jgi:hypothetical protein